MHLRRPVLSLSLFALALASVSVRADEAKKADKSSRVAVAKCLTPKGSMLRREALDKPWVVVDQNESLYTGDLIIGLPMSVLESKDGAVHLTVRSDLSEFRSGNPKSLVGQMGTLAAADSLSFFRFRTMGDIL